MKHKLTICIFCLLATLCLLNPINTWAKDVMVKKKSWQISYIKEDKSFRLEYKQQKSYRTLLTGVMPEAVFDDANGAVHSVSSASFNQVEYVKQRVKDEFGRGYCHSFIFSDMADAEGVTMTQNFYIYDDYDYLVTSLSIGGGNNKIRSNSLAPIVIDNAFSLYTPNKNNRMLKVPFDNDSFVRYHKYPLRGDMITYEATALYEGESRNGLVIGSVEHNRWKSAIAVEAKGDGTIKSMKVFSGVSNNETRDVLPHGKVEGTTVTSARFFVGFFEDWREGMEMFGEANTLVQPMRNTWTGGTPFGWQSWGVMSDKNSYQADVDVSNYFHDVLAPAGFCGEGGLNVISIDAWDNLSNEQKVELNEVCKQNGQVAGTYCSPFALWWNEDMLERKLDGQTEFTGWDCVLKINGKPYKLDGAYCLDPTHPGVKSSIATQLRVMKAQGFKYVKVDFTSNGMVQADSYYNPQVKTAVEAYNEGFTHFIDEADKGEPMFVALSIAPLFPYQYGNSRRIACDTWGKIVQSEYSLNAISGGWWTNRFYQFNDPDHLVLVGNDKEKETLGENRARITNGVVSGMLLVADNYSLSDNSGRGDAALSRERARQVMMNREVNEAARLGKSFMPVYGYAEYNGKDDGAESCYMYHTPRYLYVAVVNFNDKPLNGNIPLALLGICRKDTDGAKELWSGNTVILQEEQIDYSVPAKDALLFRIKKNK